MQRPLGPLGGVLVALSQFRLAWSPFAARRMRWWQQRLGLEESRGALRRVHPLQVTGEDGRPGSELVGVVVEGGTFTVLHTRRLREDDIVHELLHVLNPRWSHELVETWTGRLASNPKLASTLPLEGGVEGRRLTMKEISAFNLRTRKKCTILEPEIVTMKNGRKAVRGLASDDGKTKVFRILGAAEAAELAS